MIRRLRPPNRPTPRETSSPTLLVAYQILAARAQANRATTWQIPTLTLAAQAFLIGVSAQVQAITSVRIVLALTILLIGGVSLFLQFKIGLYTILDTYLLDRFEERLLTGENARFRLHHSQSSAGRAIQFGTPDEGSTRNPGTRWYWRASAPLRLFPLTIAWGALQLLITAVGATVPLLPLLVAK